MAKRQQNATNASSGSKNTPVTEWGAPGAYTRSQILDPHHVPNEVEGDARTTPRGETAY